MSRRTNQHRPCTRCGRRQTRSDTRLCWQCRPAPAVHRDGNTLVIEDLGPIPIAQALQMAHRIADEATP